MMQLLPVVQYVGILASHQASTERRARDDAAYTREVWGIQVRRSMAPARAERARTANNVMRGSRLIMIAIGSKIHGNLQILDTAQSI